MSCEIPIILANGARVELDSGIAEAIKILNEKGYFTTCCCEGHKMWCDGYKHPKQRIEYGQFSPLFIDFRQDCIPPYFPQIYPYTASKNHARQIFERDRFVVYFELYKRQRSNVDEEHLRVLNEILKWAIELPEKETI